MNSGNDRNEICMMRDATSLIGAFCVIVFYHSVMFLFRLYILCHLPHSLCFFFFLIACKRAVSVNSCIEDAWPEYGRSNSGREFNFESSKSLHF